MGMEDTLPFVVHSFRVSSHAATVKPLLQNLLLLLSNIDDPVMV